MADAIPHNFLEFTTLDDIGMVRVEDIDVGDRLRPVDPIHAEIIGCAMLRDGQDTPIVVTLLPGKDRWTLVAGAHRVAGAILKGIEELRAERVGPNALKRRQREVSENLFRKELAPVERAAFIAELVTIHKLRIGVNPEGDGRRASAVARWQKALKTQSDDATATIAVAYGWADEVAAQTGFSQRTVYNDLLLQSRLTPSVVARLRECRHPVLNNATQLRALAKLDERTQFLVAGRLMDGAKSVSAARAILDQKPAPDPEAKRLSAFIGAFARMGVTERKAALHELVGMMTPVQAITFRDALAEREEAFQ